MVARSGQATNDLDGRRRASRRAVARVPVPDNVEEEQEADGDVRT